MKKIIINLLAISALSATVVACSSGSSSGGSSGPAAPAVTKLTPPTGFTTTSAASGVAVNAAAGQIAVPTTAGYVTYTLPGSVSQDGSAAKALFDNATTATFVSNSDGSVTMTIPATAGGSVVEFVLTQLPTTATMGAESYTLTNAATSNVMPVTYNSTSALLYGSGNNFVILTPNTNGAVPTPVLNQAAAPLATGNLTTVSAATLGSVPYLSAGSENGDVVVLNGSTLTPTSLSAQAPAGKYTAGNVNSFGFPATLNTGNTLVGYWNVGTVGTSVNIYKITGTYSGSTPVGSGFLNTTESGVQTTNSGAVTATFTGFPAKNTIYSSYVDAAGNVWVGTTAGSLYVLRAGFTAWTNVALATGTVGSITVQSNGANGGVIASGLIGGANSTYSAN